MSYVQATTSMSSLHQQIQAGMFYVQATSIIFLCIVCINKFVHVPPFFVVQCDICIMSYVQATSTIMYVLDYFYVQSASTNLCMFHDFFYEQCHICLSYVQATSKTMYVLKYFYVRYASTNLCMFHDFSYAQGDLCMSYVQATSSMSSLHQQIYACSMNFLCIG